MKLIVPEKGRVVTSTGLLKSGSLRVVLVLVRVTGRQLRYEYGTQYLRYKIWKSRNVLNEYEYEYGTRTRTRTAIRQPTTGDAVQFGAALVLVYGTRSDCCTVL